MSWISNTSFEPLDLTNTSASQSGHRHPASSGTKPLEIPVGQVFYDFLVCFRTTEAPSTTTEMISISSGAPEETTESLAEKLKLVEEENEKLEAKINGLKQEYEKIGMQVTGNKFYIKGFKKA